MAVSMQEMALHEGEEWVRTALKVPHRDNPTVPSMSPQLANHLRIAPLIALGTIDGQGHPWTTLWGNGENGFAQPLTDTVIGIKTPVTSKYDPVVEELVGKEATGEIIKEEGRGRMVAGLTIDLEKRKRVKLFGRMVAGALSSREDEATDAQQHIAEVQLVLRIEQSLGNCPKYINQQKIVAALSKPELVSDSPKLPQEALDLIDKSDLFLMSSSQDGDKDMDTNHRGGPAGFVRVLSNDDSGTVLVYPEYSGNRLYQSLGNLSINPVLGITFPDFETGDMLYCTGRTEILIGKDAAALLPRSNLAVKTTLTAARFVRNALPFRGIPGDRSPYNPTVRYLPAEKVAALSASPSQSPQQATLLSQIKISPTISRFQFSLTNPSPYKPGQYVTLDFAPHLDMGYSHMRDDDPQSLNDDFVRTFTVSNPMPSVPSAKEAGSQQHVFEITIRRVGVATAFLFRQRPGDASRAPLEIGVMGFGGEFEVLQDSAGAPTYFIAAGVGITPLLPSLGSLDLARLRVFWSVKQADLPFVLDVVKNGPQGLAATLVVFVSDGKEDGRDEEELKGKGINVQLRRIEQGDLVGQNSPERFYVCSSVPMRKAIETWLPRKKLVFEDFNF